MPTSLRLACSPRFLSKPRSRSHPGSYLCRSYKKGLSQQTSIHLGSIFSVETEPLTHHFPGPLCIIHNLNSSPTIQVQPPHVSFILDSLSHHERRLHGDLAKGEVDILNRSVVALWSDACVFHQGRSSRGELTVTMGSPSLSTAARAMAPSERTRQSPKLTTCTFLRCLKAYEVHQ